MRSSTPPVMSIRALTSFLEEQIEDARQQGVLFSLHLKATMMKVSDPIIFGHAVKVFFKDVFQKHGATLAQPRRQREQRLGQVCWKRIQKLAGCQTYRKSKRTCRRNTSGVPILAMVNSGKGITNLHVPSDVIIDASMPAMIRTSGQMWNKEGKLQDTKAVIPDRSYAGVYQETINFCKENGAFDPRTMGTVPNVGLMAQAAEEYGSHDKTFEIPAAGTVRVVDASGAVADGTQGRNGDIWRMCQTKDAADSGLGEAGRHACTGDGYHPPFSGSTKLERTTRN